VLKVQPHLTHLCATAVGAWGCWLLQEGRGWLTPAVALAMQHTTPQHLQQANSHAATDTLRMSGCVTLN
jgi:hypothetical protein